jgi:hypothetical protein
VPFIFPDREDVPCFDNQTHSPFTLPACVVPRSTRIPFCEPSRVCRHFDVCFHCQPFKRIPSKNRSHHFHCMHCKKPTKNKKKVCKRCQDSLAAPDCQQQSDQALSALLVAASEGGRADEESMDVSCMDCAPVTMQPPLQPPPQPPVAVLQPAKPAAVFSGVPFAAASFAAPTQIALQNQHQQFAGAGAGAGPSAAQFACLPPAVTDHINGLEKEVANLRMSNMSLTKENSMLQNHVASMQAEKDAQSLQVKLAKRTHSAIASSNGFPLAVPPPQHARPPVFAAAPQAAWTTATIQCAPVDVSSRCYAAEQQAKAQDMACDGLEGPAPVDVQQLLFQREE